jgi:hypothetical protein
MKPGDRAHPPAVLVQLPDAIPQLPLSRTTSARLVGATATAVGVSGGERICMSTRVVLSLALVLTVSTYLCRP